MANPQLENGHLRLANEIVDALVRSNLSKREWKILMFLLRKTYGWQKKADFIALSQYSKATGLSRTHCCTTLKTLQLRNMITVTKTGNSQVLCYQFQKNYDNWRVLPKRVTVTKSVTTVTQNGNEVLPKQVIGVPKMVTTKDTLTKDIFTKDTLTKEKNTLVASAKADARQPEASLTPDQLAKSWNSVCDKLPKIITLTEGRKIKTRLRLKEHPDADWWNILFKRINSTPFLCGEGGKNWRASFDWVMANAENTLKVMEGKYDGTERDTSQSSAKSIPRPQLGVAPEPGKYAGVFQKPPL